MKLDPTKRGLIQAGKYIADAKKFGSYASACFRSGHPSKKEKEYGYDFAKKAKKAKELYKKAVYTATHNFDVAPHVESDIVTKRSYLFRLIREANNKNLCVVCNSSIVLACTSKRGGFQYLSCPGIRKSMIRLSDITAIAIFPDSIILTINNVQLVVTIATPLVYVLDK